MKKILISLFGVVSLFGVNNAFAANKVGIAIDQGLGVTGQFDNINAFIGNDGVSGDYIFNQGSFNQDIPFNWYVAGGAYYNWSGKDDSVGVRLPLGLTLPFAGRWDVYGQAAPALDSNIDNQDLKIKIDFALGIRYAF